MSMSSSTVYSMLRHIRFTEVLRISPQHVERVSTTIAVLSDGIILVFF